MFSTFSGWAARTWAVVPRTGGCVRCTTCPRASPSERSGSCSHTPSPSPTCDTPSSGSSPPTSPRSSGQSRENLSCPVNGFKDFLIPFPLLWLGAISWSTHEIPLNLTYEVTMVASGALSSLHNFTGNDSNNRRSSVRKQGQSIHSQSHIRDGDVLQAASSWIPQTSSFDFSRRYLFVRS